MIELRNVSQRFRQHHALRDVSLTLPAGRTAALIGPSGCGKSTLLRCVAGLMQPDEGTVEVDGRPLTADRLAAHRQRLGYVIQNGGLFPHLDGRGNVTLAARHLGWRPADIEARVQVLAGQLRVPARCLAQYPATLSGGQRQRLSLMRALMLDPPLLLMDEPLAALDPMIRAGLQAELRTLFEQLGKTVLWVTHDLAEAAWFADDILLLNDGRVVQQGRLEDLRMHPASDFVTQFLTAQQQLHAGLP
ncbi:MAG: ABC transporter ATP-binding protein [Salinisphaeraceae bacterium]|nr:ABC transporter ATP-binding protein [Salinisphaeraceae bacterium]